MDELDRMVLFGNIAWYVGLLGPVVAGAVAALLARRPGVDRVRVCFVGALAAFAFGAAGSYLAGESILNAIGSVSDLPWHLFLKGWHRMWYPLGVGLFVGIALALFAFVSRHRAVEPTAAGRP